MLTVACAALLAPTAVPDDYREEISNWRAARENRLKADEGWLSVAGLYWLKEGANTLGTDESSDIVLPPGSAPAKVGAIRFEGGKAHLTLLPGIVASAGDQAISSLALRSDAEEKPTKVRLNTLTLTLIKRGHRTGIRLYDANSPNRREFKGLSWFDIDPALRIRARYVAYPVPKRLAITNIIGDTAPSINPGYATFTIGKDQVRLEAEGSGDSLFFNFRDTTNGKLTYSAGRFLDTVGPKNGVVILDFNKAYNPPCAFTPFATYPLAPRANHLSVAVNAGELNDVLAHKD